MHVSNEFLDEKGSILQQLSNEHTDMKTVMKWFGISVAVLLVLAIGLFISARLHDGPMIMIAGGPFTTGELVEAPDDWTYLTDRAEIEFQTMDPDTSRIVWLAVWDKRMYFLSGYMTTGYGKIWKQWPNYMEADNRVLLRIDGKLYEQQLVRVMEHDQLADIVGEFGRKYGFEAGPEVVTSGYGWLYEVVDR